MFVGARLVMAELTVDTVGWLSEDKEGRQYS